ncbi:MAG: Ig-like domain repeat protein [Bryobacter sp.]|nr:Ig-like domain repeat protein [Bryobacter sp.]
MRILSVCRTLILIFFLGSTGAVVYTPPPFHYGNFSPLAEHRLYPHDGFVVADFSQDGRSDVAAWNSAEHRLVVYHADAAGNLAVAQVLELERDSNLFLIFVRFHGKAADVNGDARPDLVLLEEGTARFHFFESQADGRLAPPRTWRNTSFSFALGWEVADVNQDRLADLVFSEDDDKFVVAIQRPGFTFDRQWWPTSATFPGYRGRGVSLAATSNPERPDAAWTVENEAGLKRTLLFRNEGETRFLPGLALRLNTRSGAFVWGDLTADLNGDGKPDLLQRDAEKGTISTYSGAGGEVFRLLSTQKAEVFGQARWLDLNQDDALDLVEYDAARICYFVNQGNGKLASPACESNAPPEGEQRLAALADLNGDRLCDRVLLLAPEAGDAAFLHWSIAGRMALNIEAPLLPQAPVAGQLWKASASMSTRYPHFLAPRGTVELQKDGATIAQLPLDAAGKAEGEIPLPAGQYELSFAYSGDALYAPSISEARSLLLQATATRVELGPLPNSLAAGQTLNVSIRTEGLHAAAKVPTGEVSLQRNGQELARLPLVRGAAAWSGKGLPPGEAEITAEFLPNESFAGSRSAARRLSIVGDLDIRNAASQLEIVAPGSLVHLRAAHARGEGRFTIGKSETVAKPLAASWYEVLLPADAAIATQEATLRVGDGTEQALWRGRVRVARQAPGILVPGAYWTQLQKGVVHKTAPLQPEAAFSLAAWRNPAGSTLTLTLVGTGWRNATATSQIAVYFNSTRLAVLAYGAHPDIPGLDTLTVQVPSTYRPPSGATLTPLTRLRMTVGNVASNHVELRVVP